MAGAGREGVVGGKLRIEKRMKITLIVAMSVDGRIAAGRDELTDWTSAEDKRFFVLKTKEAGVVIMGRRTFQTIGEPLPERLNVVMTHQEPPFDDIPGVLECTRETPGAVLRSLASRGYTEAAVVGGREIYSAFLEAGLVTDIYVTIEPLLFGSGIPLVENISSKKLQLITMEKLGTQSVLLHYVVL